jgi:tetratricopeptide (TPR) repeat protein
MAKRVSAAKAPAKKAIKVASRAGSKAKPTKKAAAKPTRKVATPKAKLTKKAAARKPATVSRERQVATARAGVKKTHTPVRAMRAQKPFVPPPPPPRQPTVDETAALHAFDRAHREFTRGRFQEARNQFRVLLERYAQVSEVAARARTYLAISESRLRTDSMLPRDADSLYDRGVIELNRGEYVAAQEMFERALKREPEAAHIHYGLAATRARLGAIDLALQSLQRALDLQPTLRVRAQHDHDLTPLRNDPDFDKLVFTTRL